MRDSKRQVILDFTSLLDVVMLILFFFVIFAGFDSARAIDEAEKAQALADERIAEADRRLSEAEKAFDRAEKRAAELAKDETLARAVLLNNNGDIGRAVQLQLELGISDDGKWDITVTAADSENVCVIGDVRDRAPSVLAEELDGIIAGYSYAPSDAVLVNLVYDSEAAGSRRAKDNADDMLKIMRETYGYRYLFSAEVDICKKSGGST